MVRGCLLMKEFIKLIVITLLCQLATPVFADQGDANVLVRMFDWWNAAMKTPDGLTEQAFREYYTEDAAIIINGNELVRGIKPMVEHFRSARARIESVEIVLPFEEEFESESGDHIFTYHLVRTRADGADRLSHLMGYAAVDDGRISLINFVRYDQPAAADAVAMSIESQ